MRAACHAAWVLALVPACFHPSYDHPLCGPGGACPDGLACSAQGICEGIADQPADAGVGVDAAPDAPDAPADAQTCFGTGLLRICLASAPTVPLIITDPTPIDTSNSPMCTAVISGGDYCVLAGTMISVDVKLRATGARPLVLVARDSIATTGGIDVGSHRGAIPETGAGADPVTCQAGTAPVTAGGGAGGSFAGLGGGGGAGASGSGAGGLPGSSITTIVELRGGCRAQDGAGPSKGAGGHGGGAVFLIAGTSIEVGGNINAAGEGGGAGVNNSSGAGGGGAGGMIGFDAPTIMGTSLVLANGGGGGEGSGLNTAGNAGFDPSSTAAATGGANGTAAGGDGGNGSAGPAGGPGAQGLAGTTGGGGGGGGGAGFIKAPATATLGALVSPPATP